MEYVRSRQRVIDHGEVFTPRWLVDDMLKLVDVESARIDSRFLEPACGSGNFVVPVLERKLKTVQDRYGSNEFEKRHQSLAALMSIYGIELLNDNVTECRANLLGALSVFLKLDESDFLFAAAGTVVECNVIRGDALTMVGADEKPILFAEWAYLGKGRFQRRDFRFDSLTQMSLFGEGTLFEGMDKAEIFRAERDDYRAMTIEDLAKSSLQIKQGD